MTELFIQKNDNKTNIALVENGKLIEYYLEDENLKGKEGNSEYLLYFNKGSLIDYIREVNVLC